MKLKNTIAKLLALVLAIGTTPMFLLPCEVAAAQTDQTFAVKESLNMEQSMSIPDITFNYSYTAYAVDLNTSSSDISNMPALKSSINITSSDTATNNTGDLASTKTVTKSGDILAADDTVLSGADFNRAGIYSYIVTQNTVSASSFATSSSAYKTFGTSSFVSADSTAYLLSISVDNKSDKSGLYIDSIVAAKFTNETAVSLSSTNTKSSELEFSNNFTGYEGFVIKNTTTGRGADLTKSFTYQVTLSNSTLGALADDTVVVGYIYDSNGTAVTDNNGQQLSFEFKFKNGSATNNIILKDDQICSIERTKTTANSASLPYLPVGTKYSINMVAESNYTTDAIIKTPGVTDKTIEGSDGTVKVENVSIQSNNFKAGAGDSSNTVSFTANRNEYLLTGIIQNNFGLFVLLAISAIVLVFMCLLNRRKRD